MPKDKLFKSLPEYLQPRIISAVAYVNSGAPDIAKAIVRIEHLRKSLSDKEKMWVISLLTFDKLLDMVKDSPEFAKYQAQMKERTLQ